MKIIYYDFKLGCLIESFNLFFFFGVIGGVEGLNYFDYLFLIGYGKNDGTIKFWRDSSNLLLFFNFDFLYKIIRRSYVKLYYVV